MITSTELLRQYQRILAEPIKDDSEESVSLLFHTDWVKIMIIRDPQSPRASSIEVEISLPPCIIELSLNDVDTHPETARKFVKDTISHLEYLLRLEEAGLALGILSAEGIWSASMEVLDCPDEIIFKSLIPPF
jgi:hypothetical protein